MIDSLSRAQARYKKSPRGKYVAHKINAKQRGIPFELSFVEWWDVWQKSGHWNERGNKWNANHWVMMRNGDIGAYRKGNVFIGEFRRNFIDGHKKIIRKRHTAKTTTVTFEERLEKYPFLNDIKLPLPSKCGL